jgi:hypothetical protein
MNRDDPQLDELERHLHSILAQIREDHAKAAEPFIKRLMEIQILRQPVIVLSREQAQGLGINELAALDKLENDK